MYEGDFEELNEASPTVFEFSGYCYVASFSAVVWAVYHVTQTPGFTSEDIIEVAFRIAAAIILPCFVAFGGWLLFGRNSWATNIIWFLGFALLGGHGFTVITGKSRGLAESAALAALPEPMSGAEIIARIVAGGSVANTPVWRRLPQTAAEGGDLRKTAALDAATRAHLGQMAKSGKQFAAAFQSLGQGRSVAGRRYGSEGQLERQIFTTQLQLGLIKAFPETLEKAPQEYRKAIAAVDSVGLSDAEREAIVAGYLAGAERVGPRLLEYHGIVKRHGEATLEALLLFSREYGAWQRELESRTIVFESKEAQAAYDEIMEELERVEPEIKALRKRLPD